MKIGLLTAMGTELDAIIRHFDDPQIHSVAGLDIHEGGVDGLPVALCAGGICKVNAAIASQVLIDRFGVTHLVMMGVAGGMDKRLGIHALAFSERLAQHDVDKIIFTTERPFVPGGWFQGDAYMLSLCRELADRDAFAYPAFFGDMVSGEQFIDREGRQEIIDKYNPLCVDMESAAAAHVCHVFGVPFLAIRAMSDTDAQSGEMEYVKHVVSASLAAAQAALALIREMAARP